MRAEDAATLSYYRELTALDGRAHAMLVRHVESGVLYVKKSLSHYDLALYRSLERMHISGVPGIRCLIEDGDRLIVLEEYVNGISLADYLQEHGPLCEETAIAILQELCHILRQLHSADPPIIHRDIKPANVMLTADFRTVLVDFDAAKAFDKDKHRDTVLMGTVHHAAPEQYGFGQSDARTDIYALGVLLCILLTGRTPDDIPDIRIPQGRMKEKEGTALRQPLARIIRKCTEMDPEKRYATVSELAAALDAAASPPGWRSYLPPGFRSGTPWKAALAGIGYALIAYLGLTTEFNDIHSSAALALYRLGTVLLFLLPVLILANYRGVAARLPLARSDRPSLSRLGRILWSILAGLLVMILVALAAAPFEGLR